MGALRSFCLNYAGLDKRPSESLPPLPSPSFRGAEEIGAYLTLRRLRCDQTRPPRHLPRGTDTSRDPRRQGLLCAARPLSLAQGRDEAGASGRGPGLLPGRPARFALCVAHTARAPARRALYGGGGVASTAPGPGGRCLHCCPREHRLAVRQAWASAVLSVTASQKQWLMTPGNSLLPMERGVRERPDVRGAQPGRPASGFTGINEKCFPSIQVRVGTGWAKAEPGTTRGALGSGAHGMPGGHVRAVPTSPGRGRRVISATSLCGPFPRRRLRGDLLSRMHPLPCLLHQECPREQHPAGKWRAGLAGTFGSGGCYGM